MGTDKKYCKGGNIIGWYKEPKNIMCKKGGGSKIKAVELSGVYRC